MKGIVYFYDIIYVIVAICVGIIFVRELSSELETIDEYATRQTDKILYDVGDGIRVEYVNRYGAYLPVEYMELKRTGAEVIADLYVQDQYSPTTNLIESANDAQTIWVPDTSVSEYKFRALKDCVQRWSTNLLNLKSSGFNELSSYELILNYDQDRWEYKIVP